MPKRTGAKLPQKRRARGEGTIFPDKRRGGFIVRVPFGKKASGETDYAHGHAKTRAEAVLVKKNLQPPGPSTTLAEWWARWFPAARLRPGTRITYANTWRARLSGTPLASARVTAITAWDVEAQVAEWGRGEGAHAASTIITTLAHLSSCMTAAVRARLITRNPLADVARPRKPRVKFDLFSAAELRQVIDLASTRRQWYAFALCAAVGCRIGEAIAIEPGDYDAGALSIQRTWTRAGVGPPKTENGTRTVRVPALVRPLFTRERWATPCYTTMVARWEGFLERAGLRYRALHQLRHSVASHALAAHVPIGNIARDLGDAIETIVKTYCHPTPGRDVCGAMEELLGGGKVAQDSQTPEISGKKRHSV